MSRRGGVVFTIGRVSLVKLRSSALLWLLFSGEVAASELAAGTWPSQLPPGWTVEWDPSSDGGEWDH